MRAVFLFSVCWVLALSWAFPAQGNPAQAKPSSAQAPAAPPATPAPEIPKDFLIGPEDVLSIYVWKEPELSLKECFVRPDGKISVPLVGELDASGVTALQLQEKITQRLKEFIAAPVVTVTVAKVASKSVSIVGEVTKPGAYPLMSPMTVLELLARAGGLTLDANGKKIKILRKEGRNTLQFSFNYNDVKSGKKVEENINLKTGDIVIVP